MHIFAQKASRNRLGSILSIVVCTESQAGELRYSAAIRYDAWRWIQMIQPDENTVDKSLSREARVVCAASVVKKTAARDTKIADLTRLVLNANYPGLLR